MMEENAPIDHLLRNFNCRNHEPDCDDGYLGTGIRRHQAADAGQADGRKLGGNDDSEGESRMPAGWIVRTLSSRTLASCAIGLVFASVSSVNTDSEVSVQARATDDVRIELTMDDYSFAPNPLRIPAGRPVTLVITNVGGRPHEFMAGREAREDQFTHDLFDGLHVNVEEVMPEHSARGHAEHAADAQEPSAESGHTHAAGHEHGTMVENQPEQTFLMSFTLPESRRGEWNMGCFLPGHYEAGMHGTLIVE